MKTVKAMAKAHSMRYHVRMKRLGLVGLLAAACPFAQPAAALDFAPCGRPAGIVCASVQVPVDRSGGVPGTIQLYVEKIKARSKPSRGALFAITGGPGEAATARTRAFARELAPAFTTRDLIVFDQRGTGRSDQLRCANLEGTQCVEIGPKLHFFTTRDSADDIEAVRRAIGVERVALYGLSYGTRVALAYAKRYPSHVERLVLDSVVSLDGYDFFERDSYRAVRGVLKDECRSGGCSSITDDVVSDVATLAVTAQAGTLSVPVITPSGEAAPTNVHVTQYDLFRIVYAASSFDPVVRARVASAVRAALSGDGYPLSRLLPASGRLVGTSASDSSSVDEALRRATLCEELPPAWWRTQSYGERLTEAQSVLAATSPDVFYPFTWAGALDGDPFVPCLPWQVLPDPPVITGAGPPDAPALLLNGVDDAVTPIESASRTAALFRRSTLMKVPDMGHAVLATAARPGPALSKGSACAREALARFFAGRKITPCKATPHLVPPAALPPLSVSQLAPWPKIAGLRGRTLAAVLATLADVKLTALSPNSYQVGLRGGRFAREGRSLRLSKIVYVPGVVVTGTYAFAQGAADLQISGDASRGTVVIAKNGRISGRLDGRPLQATVH